MLEHVFKYTLKVLRFSTIWFQQMSCVIKPQLQFDAIAVKAIICWAMQSASAKNVIPMPNVISAQLNKHSVQWQWHFSRCLCFCLPLLFYIHQMHSASCCLKEYFKHQKSLGASKVDLQTSCLMQFQIFSGCQTTREMCRIWLRI